ncbi:hypothetical protein V5O48_011366 [Marasmius crinis-equi]|uniref:F-box domain-containing protein n=1 Tax=Marasmius crinis-equi TaxID=585013 RepID=A0ABR3F5V5_9AGAR
MDRTPNEILREILLNTIGGEHIVFEACYGFELQPGSAGILSRVSKLWRAMAEKLPVWHKLDLYHDNHVTYVNGRLRERRKDMVFLERCMQRARETGKQLEIDLEVMGSDIREGGNLCCETLWLLSQSEQSWATFSYRSVSQTSCELASRVLHGLQDHGARCDAFSLELRHMYWVKDADWMGTICSIVGTMEGLVQLSMKLDYLWDDMGWDNFLPTTVWPESRWSYLRHIEIEASSTVLRLFMSFCPSLDSIVANLEYEDILAPARVLTHGSLRSFTVRSTLEIEHSFTSIFPTVTVPCLEYLEIDTGRTLVDEVALEGILRGIIGFIGRVEGPLGGMVRLRGISDADVQVLKGKGLEVER